MKDLTGQKFNRLLVVGFDRRDTGDHYYWKCKCDCGIEKSYRSEDIKTGRIVSCGCYHREKAKIAKYNLKHGKSGTKTYCIWATMLRRCDNITQDSYKYYGAKGISVCERWYKFENFLADMGEVPHGKTIDRIDNKKNYCPENCRWATRKEQANNMSSNVKIKIGNIVLSMSDMALLYGIPYSTLKSRLQRAYGDMTEVILKYGLPEFL